MPSKKNMKWPRFQTPPLIGIFPPGSGAGTVGLDPITCYTFGSGSAWAPMGSHVLAHGHPCPCPWESMRLAHGNEATGMRGHALARMGTHGPMSLPMGADGMTLIMGSQTAPMVQ